MNAPVFEEIKIKMRQNERDEMKGESQESGREWTVMETRKRREGRGGEGGEDKGIKIIIITNNHTGIKYKVA